MARQITVEFAADATKLTRAMNDVDKSTRSFGDKLTSAGKKMTVGFTLPILAGLGAATKAAADDEAAQVKLAKTLENTVGATDKVVASVESHLEAMQKVSTFSDDDLRPAFAALVSETRNVKDAQDLMRTAMDLAAARGISLEQAAQLLIKAHNGQTKGLQALGIETKNTEGQAASFEAVMRDVNAVVGGQAQEALSTTAGKSAVLKRDLGEMAESIGVKVLPHLNKLVGWASDILGWFDKIPEPAFNVGLGLAAIGAAAGPILSVVNNVKALTTAVTNPKLLAAMGRLAPLVAALGLGAEIKRIHEEGPQKGKGLAGTATPLDLLAKLLPFFHEGGVVPGPRGTNVPIMAQAGETVMPVGGAPPVAVHVYIDGREIHQSLLRLQRTSGSLGLT